jgi:hypothetical protein
MKYYELEKVKCENIERDKCKEDEKSVMYYVLGAM